MSVFALVVVAAAVDLNVYVHSPQSFQAILTTYTHTHRLTQHQPLAKPKILSTPHPPYTGSARPCGSFACYTILRFLADVTAAAGSETSPSFAGFARIPAFIFNAYKCGVN